MGDEVSMRKYLILAIGTTTLLANSHHEDLVAQYKTMFEKIGEKRLGVEESNIDALRAPFVTVEKKKKVASEGPKAKPINQGFVLQAILNKSAKISGKWYRLHGEVKGMKIISVRDNYVWLKNDEFRKKLILGSKNEKISIK